MSTIVFDKNIRRQRRIRAKINGSEVRPRISIFRSNNYIYAQAIDDISRKTVASASSIKIGKESSKREKRTEEAKKIGQELAKALLAKNVKAAVFDRGRYAYNGRVKMLAEGLREGGITV